jgi:hypothetical protein
MARQNFRADVGRAAVLVGEQVVAVVVQNDGVFQRFQFQFRSGKKEKRRLVKNGGKNDRSLKSEPLFN